MMLREFSWDVVLHIPRVQEVMGSKPARSWTFFTSSILWISLFLSFVSLCRPQREVQQLLIVHNKMLNCAAWGKQSLMCTELANTSKQSTASIIFQNGRTQTLVYFIPEKKLADDKLRNLQLFPKSKKFRWRTKFLQKQIRGRKINCRMMTFFCCAVKMQNILSSSIFSWNRFHLK